MSLYLSGPRIANLPDEFHQWDVVGLVFRLDFFFAELAVTFQNKYDIYFLHFVYAEQ